MLWLKKSVKQEGDTGVCGSSEVSLFSSRRLFPISRSVEGNTTAKSGLALL